MATNNKYAFGHDGAGGKQRGQQQVGKSKAFLQAGNMVNAADDQRHQVRLGPHIGIRQHDMQCGH